MRTRRNLDSGHDSKAVGSCQRPHTCPDTFLRTLASRLPRAAGSVQSQASSWRSQCKFAAMPMRPAAKRYNMVIPNSCPTTQGDLRKIEAPSPLRPRPKMSKPTDAASRIKLSVRFTAVPRKTRIEPRRQFYCRRSVRSSQPAATRGRDAARAAGRHSVVI